jgi:deazaflavin-dependent oxidoreductase (nitroreductase family)
MPAAKNDLKDHLSKRREIEMTVIGRKSGSKRSRPVWFVLEAEELYLLPVEGSDTQWYKNVLEDPAIWIEAGDKQAEFQGVPVIEAKAVSSIVAKFREKYGAGDVKKYYSKLDVAVVVLLK